MTKTFQNPILPGFFPDPSICRVGEDYYLVTSSFEYYPGIPIFHSRDLIHWRQIGHVLDRPSQLDLTGIASPFGIYAPTIRYAHGCFYVITTLMTEDGHQPGRSGNFIVTADDSSGPWSDPYWLEDAPGIDPSLFFDDDGRVYCTGIRTPLDGPQYHGHQEIWLQELDLKRMQLVGEKAILWTGYDQVYPEAPHLYKRNGIYYLTVAESGTGHDHAVSIAGSRNICGPYLSCPRNPILTHRHLGLNHAITCTGHADLVETQKGEWWMVLLGCRPYGGYYRNLGREAFLTPVAWEQNWPVINPGIGMVQAVEKRPDLDEHPWEVLPERDDFDEPKLSQIWNHIRTPHCDFYSLSERAGFLRLHPLPEKINELGFPAFVGRRQQHICFEAQLAMEFADLPEGGCAGLVLLQNQDFHISLVVENEAGQPVLKLMQTYRAGHQAWPGIGNRSSRSLDDYTYPPVQPPTTDLLAACLLRTRSVFLRVQANEQSYCFYWAEETDQWNAIGNSVDGRILSPDIAGGFTGTYLGMYASTQGKPSNGTVDFDWFLYKEPAFTD